MENGGLQGVQAIMGEIRFGSELQLKHHVEKNYKYVRGMCEWLKNNCLEYRQLLQPPSLPTKLTRAAYQV